MSDQLEQIRENLKTLEIMNILNILQLKIPVGNVFKDWNVIRDYFKEHFKLEPSDIENIRTSKFNAQHVSNFFHYSTKAITLLIFPNFGYFFNKSSGMK